jgi:hypothetical protein
MGDQEQFATFVRSGLAQYGVEVDDVEIEVMRAVERLYGPQRDALMGADLRDVPRELDLDPSRPPRSLASASDRRARA